MPSDDISTPGRLPPEAPPTDLAIERLTDRHLAENVALARSVGWPDSESDWRIVHEAAVVLGVRREGRLVGQGALGLYGAAGVIAKMIVAPDVQRQGVGLRLLDALLREADDRAVGVLGLVATAVGQPLYERRGFVPVGEIVILAGTPELTGVAGGAVPFADAEAAARVEARWTSCPRATMLRARFRDAVATSSVTGADGDVQGYALATAQESTSTVGPVIAETEEQARILVGSILRACAGPARIDVPAERRDFRQWLQRLGFGEKGTRVEMARGATQLPWQLAQRFALASLAWG